MARNRLTWQNVTAPDYSSSMQGHALASKMFQNALGGLSDSLGSFATQQQAAEQDALLKQQEAAERGVRAQLASVLGDTEAQQRIIQQAGDNPHLRTNFLKDITGTDYNTLLTGAKARQEYDQTGIENIRTNRDNTYMDEFRPIAGNVAAYVSSGGDDPLMAMDEEQRIAFNKLPMSEQTRLMAAWSGEQTSNLGRDNTRLGMRQTEQNIHQSGTKFGQQQQEYRETRAAQATAQWIANATSDTGQRMEMVAGIEDPYVASQVRDLLASGYQNEYLGDERPSPENIPTEYDSAVAIAEESLGRVVNQGGMGEHIRNLNALVNDERPPLQVIKELRESAPDFFNKYSDGQIQDALRAVQAESKNNLNFGQAAYLSGSNLTNVGWDVAGLNYDQTHDNNIVNIIQAYLSPQAGNLTGRSTRAESGRQLLISARDAYQQTANATREARRRGADPRALAALEEREQQAQQQLTGILREIEEGRYGEAPVMEGGTVATPSDLRAQAASRNATQRQEAADAEKLANQAREQLPALRVELEMAQYQRRVSPTRENSERVVELQKQIRSFQEALQ